ncbi:MAG: DsrE family protein [Candidatus Micrarchaeota archaeon]
MKLGVVISTNDAETVWNAFRIANFSKKEGDAVKVFLVGMSVEYEKYSETKFPSKEEAQKFIMAGGEILACGTCMKSRNQSYVPLCPIASLKDLYAIIKESDKVVSF